LFDQTYVDRFKEHGIITGLLTIPFFTAEKWFKKNPREK
jgi:hypothetical protein